MVFDVSYDVKKMMADYVALELTKVVIAQENDAGYRKFTKDVIEIYNDIRRGI